MYLLFFFEYYRILGCMKRKECKEFAAIFDSNKDQFGNGKTLIEFLEDVSSLFYFFCNYYIIFIIYNL